MEDQEDNLFLETLEPCHRGTLLDKLQDELGGLLRRCDSLQKAGTMSLTIKVVPQGENQFDITADSVVKEPKPTVRPVPMFLTPDGHVTTDDPAQKHMADVVDDFRPAKPKVESFDVKTGEVIS